MGACEGDIRVVEKFIHNGGGGLISGRGVIEPKQNVEKDSRHTWKCVRLVEVKWLRKLEATRLGC